MVGLGGSWVPCLIERVPVFSFCCGMDVGFCPNAKMGQVLMKVFGFLFEKVFVFSSIRVWGFNLEGGSLLLPMSSS